MTAPQSWITRFAPWIARFALWFAVVDFGAVGALYMLDPAGEAAASGIFAQEAAGLSNLRVGFGAFHLAVAVIALYCALAAERLWAGLCIVATVTAIAVLTRIAGLIIDGAHPRTWLLLQFESLGLLVFLLGLLAEWRRRVS
jgi:hypothetical protein